MQAPYKSLVPNCPQNVWKIVWPTSPSQETCNFWSQDLCVFIPFLHMVCEEGLEKRGESESKGGWLLHLFKYLQKYMKMTLWRKQLNFKCGTEVPWVPKENWESSTSEGCCKCMSWVMYPSATLPCYCKNDWYPPCIFKPFFCILEMVHGRYCYGSVP